MHCIRATALSIGSGSPFASKNQKVKAGNNDRMLLSLSMSTMLRIGNLWFLLSAALLLASTALANDHQCERLKATLTYTQEEAPRDLSGLVRSP
jgi:hypothetical protein